MKMPSNYPKNSINPNQNKINGQAFAHPLILPYVNKRKVINMFDQNRLHELISAFQKSIRW